ncbi:hypothetical protein V1514DRAFT_325964 [Lipomyces japonicus]|uniref:uncharacterized protein n=1 Tax=Lipomyces japonicus TaxID=56871 RepID=UPI0034CE1E73
MSGLWFERTFFAELVALVIKFIGSSHAVRRSQEIDLTKKIITLLYSINNLFLIVFYFPSLLFFS